MTNQLAATNEGSLKWSRKFPNSNNNFDLVLDIPRLLDSERMNALLSAISKEAHRGLTLSSRASREFRRWFDQPDTALKSEAYVLLSNWFMTQSGDRHSMVATRCEELWDALFSCRPVERLSSPEAGRNHIMGPTEFEGFWQRLLEAQSNDIRRSAKPFVEPNIDLPSWTSERTEVQASSPLRARFDKDGLHCEVEGSPRALADFLKMMTRWERPTEGNRE